MTTPSWLPDWNSFISGLMAISGLAAVIAFGLQGDQNARTLLFTLCAAAGMAYVHQRSAVTALHLTRRAPDAPTPTPPVAP